MPLNSIPPTDDRRGVARETRGGEGPGRGRRRLLGRRRAGQRSTSCAPLHDAGVVGFKCFLLDSGVPEFPPLDDAGLRAALAELAAFDGLLIAHAEDADVIAAAPEPDAARATPAFLASRPGAAEETAIGRLVAAARDTGARVHVVHLADADALPLLRAGPRRRRADHRRDLPALPDLRRRGGARRRDVVQVLPADPRGSAPRGAVGGAARRRHRPGGQRPLAVHPGPQAARRRRLRRGLGRHRVAAGGAARGLDRRPGARHRRWTEVVRWMAEAPARLAGLPRKGAIAVGRDADLVAFAPDERWTVGGLQHRNPVTPYAGRELAGVVRRTWLRGQAAPTARRSAGCSARAACQSDGAARPEEPDDRLRPPARPGQPRPRRRRGGRQRRVLRGQGEPRAARAAGRARRVRAQGQGVRRLGDPAPAHPRPRLGGRPARCARASWPASSSTPRSSPATTRRGPRSTAPRSRGTRSVDELAKADWQPLLPLSDLAGNTHNDFAVYSDRRVTHVRLNIHPDGGVARLRVHGAVRARPAAARRRPVRPRRAGERRPGHRGQQRVLRPARSS